MLTAKEAREKTLENIPQRPFFEVVNDLERAVNKAAGRGEFSCTSVIYQKLTRDQRRFLKLHFENAGYSIGADWDDRASIVRIRW